MDREHEEYWNEQSRILRHQQYVLQQQQRYSSSGSGGGAVRCTNPNHTHHHQNASVSASAVAALRRSNHHQRLTVLPLLDTTTTSSALGYPAIQYILQQQQQHLHDLAVTEAPAICEDEGGVNGRILEHLELLHDFISTLEQV